MGTVGNLLSFAVMVQSTMRSTSTAFYMASLALADTAVLLFGCLRRWVLEVFDMDLLNQGPLACSIINFFQYWSFDVAVWILVAMTMDRVLVVTSPLKAQIYSTRKRAALSLVLVMVASAGINSHFFFTTIHTQGVCTVSGEHARFYKDIWSWIDATVYSFLPFMLLLIMNFIIVVVISKANAKKQRMTNNFKSKRKDEQKSAVISRKLTIMLLSVTCTFLLLTGPAMVLNTMRELGKPYFDLSLPKDFAKYILTRQISRVLLYLNHSINFFLYCLTGSKFRQELIAMLRCLSATERYKRRTVSMATGSIGNMAESTP